MVPLLRGVSHALAFWLALIAAFVLVMVAPGPGRAPALVYGVGLCALFVISGLYHRWRWDRRWRPLLRRLDHSTIYVFIAASCTPEEQRGRTSRVGVEAIPTIGPVFGEWPPNSRNGRRDGCGPGGAQLIGKCVEIAARAEMLSRAVVRSLAPDEASQCRVSGRSLVAAERLVRWE